MITTLERRELDELLKKLVVGGELGDDCNNLSTELSRILEEREGGICYREGEVVIYSPLGTIKDIGLTTREREGDLALELDISGEVVISNKRRTELWRRTVPISSLCAIYIDGEWLIGTPGIPLPESLREN